ncbi:MAG TPA: sensor histidine kinase, partial [Chitinophagaceae bacterium]|nr:sensor histidine kinase [Chitinophagaceae bacterium]
TSSLLLNNTDESFIMIGKDLTILEFNRAAARMVYSYYGFHLTKSMSLKVLADTEKQGIWVSICKNILKKRSFKTETQYDLPDGNYKIYAHHFKPVHNDQDEIIAMIVTSRDITEMKIAQQTLLDQKLNRQKQITKATIRAQEKERSHIGKELHDNINQILTTTKLYIDMALVEEENIREMLLTKSLENVSRAIGEIRKLSKSLVPPSLGDIGLRDAIEELISGLNISRNLQIKLKALNLKESGIKEQIKLTAYRVVQEQLNNIIKHSKAGNAEVKLSIVKKVLKVTITDDGIGFDPGKKTKGIGLSNIVNRAEVHHGNVRIVSSPGAGCSLHISIPL